MSEEGHETSTTGGGRELNGRYEGIKGQQR